jgi:hypothetical protein
MATPPGQGGEDTPIHDGVPPVVTPAPTVDFVWGGSTVSLRELIGGEVDADEPRATVDGVADRRGVDPAALDRVMPERAAIEIVVTEETGSMDADRVVGRARVQGGGPAPGTSPPASTPTGRASVSAAAGLG